MKETFREERTELVMLLEMLESQRVVSRHPAMFDKAIRQTRRKILGMYRGVLNSRKPADTLSVF